MVQTEKQRSEAAAELSWEVRLVQGWQTKKFALSLAIVTGSSSDPDDLIETD